MDLRIKTVVVGDLKTNCYIVSIGKDTAVIDPGAEAGKIQNKLEKINDLNLCYFLITHGHLDHMLALEDLKSLYPKTDLYVSENDRFLLENLSEQGYFVEQKLKNIKIPTKTVKENDLLLLGGESIRVVETSGHTLGSVCYLLKNNLFSGDTLFYHSHGRTDLPTGDEKSIKKSLAKLAQLPDKVKVYPGHGQPTSIGLEKETGIL